MPFTGFTLRITLFLLVLMTVFIRPSGATEYTAFDFERPSDFSDVTLSPSGRYIAFTMVKTGKFCLDQYGQLKKKEAKCNEKSKVWSTTHKIAIFDLQNDKIIRYVNVPLNFYVGWLEWAGENRLLTALYSETTVGKTGRGLSFGTSRIVSLPIHSDKYTVLFENKKKFRRSNRYLSQITNMLRNDPDHVIMPAVKGGDLDLWKVNVNTGVAEQIARGEKRTFGWFTNISGKPVLRFDCGDRRCRKIHVYAYNGPAKPVVAGKDWKKIKTFTTKPENDKEKFYFKPIANTSTLGQIYVLSYEKTDARSAIKIFDLKQNKYIKTVFEHPEVDVEGAILNTQTGEYAGAWYYKDRLGYSFVNKDLQKAYDALNYHFHDQQNIDVLGSTKDGNKLVVFMTSPNNPGRYYLYDRASKKVAPIIARKQNLILSKSSKTDILTIKTRDGQSIRAYHFYPASGYGPDVPLLVMPHGGPELRDYYDYNRQVQYFVNHGYQVLQVNFRGSGGYGRKFAEAGYGQWGGLMQDDVIDAVQYLYAQGRASADNACMVGYSYGGYVSLYAATHTPELFKCFVSGGGISDLLADLGASKRDYGKDSAVYKYWLKSIGNPKTDKEKLKAKSPVRSVERVEDPILLIHGEYDEIVHTDQSRRMKTALKKAGKKVEFVLLEDVGHRDWDLETRMKYLKTVEDFVSKYIH